MRGWCGTTLGDVRSSTSSRSGTSRRAAAARPGALCTRPAAGGRRSGDRGRRCPPGGARGWRPPPRGDRRGEAASRRGTSAPAIDCCRRLRVGNSRSGGAWRLRRAGRTCPVGSASLEDHPRLTTSRPSHDGARGMTAGRGMEGFHDARRGRDLAAGERAHDLDCSRCPRRARSQQHLEAMPGRRLPAEVDRRDLGFEPTSARTWMLPASGDVTKAAF